VTLALPCSSIRPREFGRIDVAQTLLSVLVMLATVEKVNAVFRRYQKPEGGILIV
jgi:hypothetical protein